MLRVLYTVFIALLVAAFVGFGISAFYPGPKAPVSPIEIAVAPSDRESAEVRERRLTFEKQSRDFEQKEERYSREVSLIALIAAIVVVSLSLLFAHRILLLSDGLMLGGLFTLIYAIIRGIASGDEIYRFIVVSIGLLIGLLVGYLKFVRGSLKSVSE